MKTQKQLANHCIIYDDECPMCELYTGAFVNLGFLDQTGRRPFSQLDIAQLPNLDTVRSKNEIPLVDMVTGKVTYGLPSLLKVLSHRWAVFGLVRKVTPLFWLISRFYSFISFNRKVIVPGNNDAQSCVPTFHLKYRVLYLLVGLLISAFTYLGFSNLLPVESQPLQLTGWLALIGGQLLIPFLALHSMSIPQRMEYLGNLMTVNIIGALLVLPAIAVAAFVTVPAVALIPYLVPVLGIMLMEHIRRVQLLKLSHWLLVGWIAYWVVILITLL